MYQQVELITSTTPSIGLEFSVSNAESVASDSAQFSFPDSDHLIPGPAWVVDRQDQHCIFSLI